MPCGSSSFIDASGPCRYHMSERGGGVKFYNGTLSISISDEAHTCIAVLERGNYNAHVRFLQENGRRYVWPSMEGVFDLSNRAVAEKNPQVLTSVACFVRNSIFRTNRCTRSEM